MPDRFNTTSYGLDIDFDDLARRDPDWAAISKSAKETKWLDFQDPKVVRQLTKSILKCNFGLSLELPEDRLCPPVPVRWNYIRWIQSLLDTTAEDYSDRYNAEREVYGIDIGTGASAIYTLLGCSSRPGWHMIGTDIDQHSLEFARRNIDVNKLGTRARLSKSTQDGSLIPLERLGIAEVDFVMTNPPFYSSKEDMEASYVGKDGSASAISFASENETICEGGDLGFVSRILEESLALRERVQWYTAMLGKLASLQQIVAKLREHEISNFAVTTLQAGHKTKRWAVAWSFNNRRPKNDVAISGEVVHAVKPWPTAQTIAVPLMSASWAGARIDTTLKPLDLRWQWRTNISTGVMETKGNVWSRAARRRQRFGKPWSKSSDFTESINNLAVEDTHEGSEDDEPVALAVKILCKEEAVEVRWLRGMDRVMFTSFCGMLKTALNGRDT